MSFCLNCTGPCNSETTDFCGPNSLSPCLLNSVCNDRSNYLKIMNFKYELDAMSSIPDIHSTFSVESTDTSVLAKMNATADGFVTCAVFPMGYSLSSTRDISTSPTSVSVPIRKNYATVKINGLLSLTSYTLYCQSQSLDGRQASITDILKTKTDITTTCCNKLIVSLLSMQF